MNGFLHSSSIPQEQDSIQGTPSLRQEHLPVQWDLLQAHDTTLTKDFGAHSLDMSVAFNISPDFCQSCVNGSGISGMASSAVF